MSVGELWRHAAAPPSGPAPWAIAHFAQGFHQPCQYRCTLMKRQYSTHIILKGFCKLNVDLCNRAGMGGFVALSCIMRALQNACRAAFSLTQPLTVWRGSIGDTHQLPCYSSREISPSPPLLWGFDEYCPFLSSCFEKV